MPPRSLQCGGDDVMGDGGGDYAFTEPAVGWGGDDGGGDDAAVQMDGACVCACALCLLQLSARA